MDRLGAMRDIAGDHECRAEIAGESVPKARTVGGDDLAADHRQGDAPEDAPLPKRPEGRPGRAFVNRAPRFATRRAPIDQQRIAWIVEA